MKRILSAIAAAAIVFACAPKNGPVTDVQTMTSPDGNMEMTSSLQLTALRSTHSATVTRRLSFRQTSVSSSVACLRLRNLSTMLTAQSLRKTVNHAIHSMTVSRSRA